MFNIVVVKSLKGCLYPGRTRWSKSEVSRALRAVSPKRCSVIELRKSRSILESDGCCLRPVADGGSSASVNVDDFGINAVVVTVESSKWRFGVCDASGRDDSNGITCVWLGERLERKDSSFSIRVALFSVSFNLFDCVDIAEDIRT